MKYREAEFYKDFRCLGGECPLTCCRDWSIMVDEGALSDYQNAPEGLREEIFRNLVTDEDGDLCFRLREDGTCALLDGDGLCPIQRQWGEEHLCEHCGAYPRFIEEYGCLTESCTAISCPEGARLVLERGVLPLRETDDGADDVPFDGLDGQVLDGLTESREAGFRLLSDRNAPIWARLTGLLDYAGDLQERLDWGEALETPTPPKPRTGGDGQSRQAVARRLLETLSGLEPLRGSWPELLEKRAAELGAVSYEEYAALTAGFQRVCPEWEEQTERLACYFLFRHWPKAVCDDRLYGRAAFTGAGCLVLYHLEALAWRENGALSHRDIALLWAAFSREVEHLEENLDALVDGLSDREAWPLGDML